MTLVTLESAKYALDHVEQYNGPGRKAEACRMLVKAKTIGWIINSPADLEPVETFTRNEETAEKFRATGWKVVAVVEAEEY